MANCGKLHLLYVVTVAEAIIKAGRVIAYTLAADMLEHYLSRDGGTKLASVKLLKLDDPFIEAVTKLKKRLEWPLVDTVLKTVTTTFPIREVSTVEGKDKIEEKFEAEYWTDLYFASHGSTITAEPRFTLMPQNDLPLIGGHAQFTWSDRYDWERTKERALEVLSVKVIYFEDMDDLQACGSAKEFDMEAKWEMTVQAKPGLKDLVGRILSQPRSEFEVRSMIDQGIQSGNLFEWSYHLTHEPRERPELIDPVLGAP